MIFSRSDDSIISRFMVDHNATHPEGEPVVESLEARFGPRHSSVGADYLCTCIQMGGGGVDLDTRLGNPW